MLRVLVLGLVLLVAAFFMLPRHAATPNPENATLYPKHLPLPAVELTDSKGRPFETADLEGDFHLLFFGYTYCPDVCPLTLQTLAGAVRELRGSGHAPGVVLASVDPARDTPGRLDAYVTNFDSEFLGVTGPSEALAPWLEALGVTVMRQSLDGGEYNMVHNPQVFVVSPKAEVIANMSNAEDSAVVAEDYRRIVRLYTATASTR